MDWNAMDFNFDMKVADYIIKHKAVLMACIVVCILGGKNVGCKTTFKSFNISEEEERKCFRCNSTYMKSFTGILSVMNNL